MIAPERAALMELIQAHWDAETDLLFAARDLGYPCPSMDELDEEPDVDPLVAAWSWLKSPEVVTP